MQGIDFFSGAGGMSVGAAMAGIKVRYAVEIDPHAAATFRLNHPKTSLLNIDIRNLTADKFEQLTPNESLVIFGGPPCQGFSTANQVTRKKANPSNWLYLDFLRLVRDLKPDWVIFENVKGLIETEGGFFLDAVLEGFKGIGYTTTYFVLNSADYGVPQCRNRFFIIASLYGIEVPRPPPLAGKQLTVRDAISDLPDLENGDAPDLSSYQNPAITEYAREMRGDLHECWNNIVTKSAPHIIERYHRIPQGGNWENIPIELMANYADPSRCHTGIYRRLKEDKPSVVIGNFRKNMLIHPWKDRGLSVREAARLQSIPDWFKFCGSIGFQQQQVGNLVPPHLSRAVFGQIQTLG